MRKRRFHYDADVLQSIALVRNQLQERGAVAAKVDVDEQRRLVEEKPVSRDGRYLRLV